MSTERADVSPDGALSLVSRDRATALAGLALLVATALAWVGLAGYEPPMGLAGFLAGWTLMMAAMMLPSIAPLALLYRGPRTPLAVGYLVVWGAVGLLPFAAMEWGLDPALPIVLALAGAYDLSPLKSACLLRCRNAAAFLMEHYRSGPLRLGVEHALWCIGCCVGLMAVLVLAASMELAWAAAIAAIVFVQKVLPLGEVSARLTGVGLLAAAVVVAAT
jgi:predicted metal-binding membrane protein